MMPFNIPLQRWSNWPWVWVTPIAMSEKPGTGWSWNWADKRNKAASPSCKLHKAALHLFTVFWPGLAGKKTLPLIVSKNYLIPCCSRTIIGICTATLRKWGCPVFILPKRLYYQNFSNLMMPLFKFKIPLSWVCFAAPTSV